MRVDSSVARALLGVGARRPGDELHGLAELFAQLHEVLGLMSFFVERSASAASSAGGAASVIALLAIVNPGVRPSRPRGGLVYSS